MNRLLIPTTSPLYNWEYGLDSPNRGEFIWMVSAAKIFSSAGWHVDILAGNHYKHKDTFAVPNNVKILIEEVFDFSTKYDGLFGIGGIIDRWPHKEEYINKIKLVMGGMFKGQFPYLGGKCIPVSPYIKDLVTNTHRVGLGFKPTFDMPRFKNQQMVLTAKEPFDKQSLRPGWALEHLRAILRLVNEGFKLTIINATDYEYWSKYSSSTREGTGYQIYCQLKKLPNVRVVSSCQRQSYIDEVIEESSIAIPLWNISSAHRAIPRGLAVLAFENIFDFYNDSCLSTLKGGGVLTEDLIYNKLKKLLTDEEFYESFVIKLQETSGVVDLQTALLDIEMLIHTSENLTI